LSTRKKRIPTFILNSTDLEQSKSVFNAITNIALSKETVTEKCTAYGECLKTCSILGNESYPLFLMLLGINHFLVQARRADGREQESGGDFFLVYSPANEEDLMKPKEASSSPRTLRARNRGTSILGQVEVIDNLDGTYFVSFTLKNPVNLLLNEFTLHVMHNNKHIEGSPFRIQIGNSS
jgi:hypothetical protein